MSFVWEEDVDPTEQEIEYGKVFSVAMRAVAGFVQSHTDSTVIVECDDIRGAVSEALNKHFKK